MDPSLTVASLLHRIQSPSYDPSTKLKHMKSRLCNFYTLSDPAEVDDDDETISEIMTSLQDTSKYTKVGHSKTLKKIATNFVPDCLYLVIEDLFGWFPCVTESLRC